MRFCSAAVPSEGILNSTVTFASSASAFSTPLRAMVQKSEALLVTKASLRCAPLLLLAPPAARPAACVVVLLVFSAGAQARASRPASAHRQTSAMLIFFMPVSSRIDVFLNLLMPGRSRADVSAATPSRCG